VSRWGLLIGILAAIAAVLFSSLAGRQPIDHRRQLVIWGIDIGNPSQNGTQAVIRAFEERHPDVHVQVTSMGVGTADPQKLMTSVVGNVAPDIIFKDRVDLPDWSSRGAFRSLDDLIARDRGKDPYCPRVEDYYPAAWNEASYNGHVYGIPMALDTRVLYWNKARFRARAAQLRAAGCDPTRPPRTWSEVMRYNKALTEFNPDHTIKMAGFIPNFGDSWLYMYAFQMNANFMSADGKKCTLDTPQSEKALAFMVQCYDQLGGFENELAFESGLQHNESDAFVTGQVAMKIDGDWILPEMARYGPQIDLGTAPPPVPDDRYNRRGEFANEKDTYVTWSGGHALVIPTGARNVRDAWEYIKFASSFEGRNMDATNLRISERRRGRVFIAKQVADRVANAALQKEFVPAVPKFAEAINVNVSMAPHSRMRPSTIVGQTLWSQQIAAMQEALYHRMTPHEALLKSQAVVQNELDAALDKDNHPPANTQIPVVAGIGILLLAILAWVAAWKRARLGKISKHEGRWGITFIAPSIFGFAILTLGPMLASLYFSFTQYDVLSSPRWVGLKNYTDIAVTDHVNTTKALMNVVYLAGIGVPLSIMTGLAVAILLNSATRGIRFYRTFFYMPSIVPGVASALLWVWVLTPDPGKGLINAGWVHTLSKWLNAPAPTWLGSAHWSKDGLILMALWSVGSGMILWLAGLKGVPNTLYEAASLDGASPTKQFWKVTAPVLSPLIFFNTVMGFIGALQEFDRMYIMNPMGAGTVGPDDSFLTPVYLLFKSGFTFFKMGYASALAWGIFLIIVLLTAFQFWLAPRWVHYEVDR
jgi:ABC-type sugar transport system permease subunit/ABC-type glycerol-3-phosphate transport system substrate-binding protein